MPGEAGSGCYTIYMMLCNYRSKTLIINLLNVNIMDKIVERVFELKEDENNVRMLIMHSRMEGEYGTILCQCTAQLNGELIVARVVDQAEPDGGFLFRSVELSYFLLNILPLFNPHNYVQVKTPPQPQE